MLIEYAQCNNYDNNITYEAPYKSHAWDIVLQSAHPVLSVLSLLNINTIYEYTFREAIIRSNKPIIRPHVII